MTLTLPGYSTYSEAKNYLHQSCSHYLLQPMQGGDNPPLLARGAGVSGLGRWGGAIPWAEKGSRRSCGAWAGGIKD